jgi:hypothetical protein
MERRYGIFVSSTRRDLDEIREVARNLIVEWGHEPILMESFPPDFKLPLDTIRREIDRCDRFVLIVGDEYGEIEPDSGFSFTHHEFRYAIEKQKPIVAFVKPETPADSPQLVAFKRLLKESIVGQWASTDELRQLFNTKVRTWLATDQDETSGWVRASEYYSVKRERDDERIHREVYTYLFNKLNPYDDVELTRQYLAQLGSRPLLTIGDVMHALDVLLRNYVPARLERHVRTYFAYKLAHPVPVDENGHSFTAHYRVGMGSSATGDWHQGLPIGKESNVNRVWENRDARAVSNATKKVHDEPNQTIPDEGSVVGAPVLYNRECVGVVGLSSPNVNELGTPEAKMLAREIGIIFSALFYAYGASRVRGRRTSDVMRRSLGVRALRNEIAAYMDEALGPLD